MIRALAVARIAVALMAAGGCAVLADFDDFTGDCPSDKPDCPKAATGGATASGGAAAGGVEAGAGGSGAAGGSAGGHPACRGPDPGLHGPEMALARRGDGSVFWIDRTEVSVADYAQFLEAGAPPPGGVCEGAPRDPSSFPCDDDPPPEDDRAPRTCVDWCEAEAYCAWAGKRLCADIPVGSVAAEAGRGELLRRSEFYAACAPTAASVHGCGAGCDPVVCNGEDARRGRSLPVGAFPTCCVPDACGNPCAVLDLSGNVAEWTGACSPLAADGSCIVRGGDFDSSWADLECDTVSGDLPRRTRYTDVGFRCCADAR